jgi:putative transcriptional regulator
MTIVRRSSDELRRRARVDAKRKAATTEEDIARHAREDMTVTDGLDFKAEIEGGRMRALHPLDVAAIRAKTGLSQDRFAKAFHISPHTLRNWEQGRRVPEGPARALLMAIDRDPHAVMRALQE